MREVLIGSGGSRCRAEKQPSGQTRQHQSAPVTRASTIGANIAILPAFTSGQEKPNARPRHRWAGFPIRPPPPPFERGHRSIRPVCSPYYSLVPSTFPSPSPRPLYTYIYTYTYVSSSRFSRRREDFFSRRNRGSTGRGDSVLHTCSENGRSAMDVGIAKVFARG